MIMVIMYFYIDVNFNVLSIKIKIKKKKKNYLIDNSEIHSLILDILNPYKSTFFINYY